MVRELVIVCLVVGAWVSPTLAADNASKSKQAAQPEARVDTIPAIMPVFGQMLAFSYPAIFNPANERSAGGHYLQESVLKGESLQKWSQMLTVSSLKGLVSNPNVTPQVFLSSIANGFKKACPESFAGVSLGELKVDGNEAFAVWVSCGTVPAQGSSYSESMVALAIKGEADYYTLQWAERGKSIKKPMEFNEGKWVGRLKALMPVKLCPIVNGEKAPYPSCINRS